MRYINSRFTYLLTYFLSADVSENELISLAGGHSLDGEFQIAYVVNAVCACMLRTDFE